MGEETVRLDVTGRGFDGAFVDFVVDRARRFSLAGRVRLGGGRLVVTARGAPALLDMLEVACLLGPADCLVDHVARRQAPAVPDGPFSAE